MYSRFVYIIEHIYSESEIPPKFSFESKEASSVDSKTWLDRSTPWKFKNT